MRINSLVPHLWLLVTSVLLSACQDETEIPALPKADFAKLDGSGPVPSPTVVEFIDWTPLSNYYTLTEGMDGRHQVAHHRAEIPAPLPDIAREVTGLVLDRELQITHSVTVEGYLAILWHDPNDEAYAGQFLGIYDSEKQTCAAQRTQYCGPGEPRHYAIMYELEDYLKVDAKIRDHKAEVEL